MPNLYCLKCNGATQYEVSKPNFCSKCGKPYVDTNIAKITPIATQKPQNIQRIRQKPTQIEENDNNEEIDEYIEVPQLDASSFSISRDLRPNRHDFRQLEGTGSQNRPARKPLKSKKRSKSSKISEKQAQIALQQTVQALNQQNKTANSSEE